MHGGSLPDSDRSPREARLADFGTGGRLTHLPGLDGLRGVAVAAVVAFHGGFGVARGGFLGVSLFFTLSGFLITSVLVTEEVESRRELLGWFWRRRLRRLVPAAWATLLAVLVAGWLWAPAGTLRRLPGDTLAAVANVANWRFLIAGQSYGELFGQPSPLLHYWSLAIEEQIYLVLPLLLVGLVWACRGSRGRVAAVLAVLAAASFALPHLAGWGVDRVYYGTDTRAGELLLGAVLGVALSAPQVRRRWVESHRWRVAGVVAGLLGAPAALWLWIGVDRKSGFVTGGGLALTAVVSCALIVTAISPVGPVGRALEAKPLRWLGRISYSLYLLHWPALVLLAAARPGWSRGVRFAVAVTGSLLLAAASTRWFETPIRRGEGAFGWGWAKPVRLAPLALVAMVAGIVVVGGQEPDPAKFDLATAKEQLDRMQAKTRVAPPPTTVTAPTATEPQASTAAPTTPEPTASATSAAPPAAVPPSAKAASATRAPTTRPVAPPGPPAPAEVLPPLPLPDVPGVGFFGDSVALSLAFAAGNWATANGGYRSAEGSADLGCGILRGGMRKFDGPDKPTAACDAWPTHYAAALANDRVDLAVVMSAQWELVDHQLPGERVWRHLGDPVYDRAVRDEYLRATDVLASRGALVVWLTVPQYGHTADDRLTADLRRSHDTRRVDRLNEIIREVAALRPATVRVVDLAAWVNPRIEDPVLRSDGSHFDFLEDNPVGKWLTEQLGWLWQQRRVRFA